jgi:hypothetical protein
MQDLWKLNYEEIQLIKQPNPHRVAASTRSSLTALVNEFHRQGASSLISSCFSLASKSSFADSVLNERLAVVNGTQVVVKSFRQHTTEVVLTNEDRLRLSRVLCRVHFDSFRNTSQVLKRKSD